MDITPMIRADLNIIQSYRGGGFKISGTFYEGALALFPERIIALPDLPKDIADITAESFAPLLPFADEIDIILYGAGTTGGRLMPPLIQSIKDNRLPAPDIMDTGAACRTYNVLLAEGRRICAVLSAV